jgi:hypothetical protein
VLSNRLIPPKHFLQVLKSASESVVKPANRAERSFGSGQEVSEETLLWHCIFLPVSAEEAAGFHGLNKLSKPRAPVSLRKG